MEFLSKLIEFKEVGKHFIFINLLYYTYIYKFLIDYIIFYNEKALSKDIVWLTFQNMPKEFLTHMLLSNQVC